MPASRTMTITDEDRQLTLLLYLLVRQVASLADCFRHLQRDKAFDAASDDLAGWRAFVRTELSDITHIVKKACEIFDLDFDDVVELGEVRSDEKEAEYRKRHPDVGGWV